ncbi:MAG: transposase [Promethearchaeota archaeon]
MVVLDNAQAHHSKELEPFLASNKAQLELMFLPRYSPNLILIEFFWNYLRKHVTHNTFFANFKDFRCAIARFIVKNGRSSPEVKNRCAHAKLFNAL